MARALVLTLLVACTAGPGPSSDGTATDDSSSGDSGDGDIGATIFAEDFEDGSGAWDSNSTGSYAQCALATLGGSVRMAMYIPAADADPDHTFSCIEEAIRGFDLTSYGTGQVELAFGTSDDDTHDAKVVLKVSEEDHGSAEAVAEWDHEPRSWTITEGDGTVTAEVGGLTLDLQDFTGWATDLRLQVFLYTYFLDDTYVPEDTVVWFDDVTVRAR